MKIYVVVVGKRISVRMDWETAKREFDRLSMRFRNVVIRNANTGETVMSCTSTR
jgi:hypothetical protein